MAAGNNNTIFVEQHGTDIRRLFSKICVHPRFPAYIAVPRVHPRFPPYIRGFPRTSEVSRVHPRFSARINRYLMLPFVIKLSFFKCGILILAFVLISPPYCRTKMISRETIAAAVNREIIDPKLDEDERLWYQVKECPFASCKHFETPERGRISMRSIASPISDAT